MTPNFGRSALLVLGGLWLSAACGGRSGADLLGETAGTSRGNDSGSGGSTGVGGDLVSVGGSGGSGSGASGNTSGDTGGVGGDIIGSGGGFGFGTMGGGMQFGTTGGMGVGGTGVGGNGSGGGGGASGGEGGIGATSSVSSGGTFSTGGSGGTGSDPIECLGCITQECPYFVECFQRADCVDALSCTARSCVNGNIQCVVDCYGGDIAEAGDLFTALLCLQVSCSDRCNLN